MRLSIFRPEALLREARRQRQLPAIAVPAICVFDPDGDVVRYLKRKGAGRIHEGWACYHTELLAFDLDGIGEVGIVGCAVGAPFAVLVAEQLFASGCRLARQRHVRRPDYSDRADAIFRFDRPRTARRGDELSLSCAIDFCRGI